MGSPIAVANKLGSNTPHCRAQATSKKRAQHSACAQLIASHYQFVNFPSHKCTEHGTPSEAPNLNPFFNDNLNMRFKLSPDDGENTCMPPKILYSSAGTRRYLLVRLDWIAHVIFYSY